MSARTPKPAHKGRKKQSGVAASRENSPEGCSAANQFAPSKVHRTRRHMEFDGPARLRQSDAFETFEARRQTLGVSRETLCGTAGLSLRQYERLVNNSHKARHATLGKIKAALIALGRRP